MAKGNPSLVAADGVCRNRVMAGRTSYIGAFLAAAASVIGTAHGQESAVRAAVASAESLGVRAGVVVLDTRGQRLLYAHRPREAFVPASNQKLVTAIAALVRLGADHEFVTRFSLESGHLRVTADGDPNWRTGSVYDPRMVFGSVAAGLARRGIHKLRGIRLDAGNFGPPGRPDGWPSDQFHLPYCATTAAHVLNAGCLTVQVDAGRRDARGHAWVEVVAPPIDPVLVGAIERTKDRKRGGKFGFSLRGDRVKLWGAARIGARAREERIAISEPVAVYERALLVALHRQGVAVSPDSVGPAEGAEFSFDHRSPLRAALRSMLVSSSNHHAEQVLRHLALSERGSGAFPAGAEVVRSVIEELVPGVDERVVVADGSGLARANRVTPRALALMLEAAVPGSSAELRQPVKHAEKARLRGLFDLLPRPGEGTLARRFAGPEREAVAREVRAKTGWIRGASSLSGYVGRDKVFAILMNYKPSRGGLNRQLKRLQERIVLGIYRWAR